jgi:hypothetical protein
MEGKKEKEGHGKGKGKGKGKESLPCHTKNRSEEKLLDCQENILLILDTTEFNEKENKEEEEKEEKEKGEGKGREEEGKGKETIIKRMHLSHSLEWEETETREGKGKGKGKGKCISGKLLFEEKWNSQSASSLPSFLNKKEQKGKRENEREREREREHQDKKEKEMFSLRQSPFCSQGNLRGNGTQRNKGNEMDNNVKTIETTRTGGDEGEMQWNTIREYKEEQMEITVAFFYFILFIYYL